MATPRGFRVRRAFRDVENDHTNWKSDKPSELDVLIAAFQGIQALPPDDPNSFFMIAGYHGAPFRGVSFHLHVGTCVC